MATPLSHTLQSIDLRPKQFQEKSRLVPPWIVQEEEEKISRHQERNHTHTHTSSTPSNKSPPQTQHEEHIHSTHRDTDRKVVDEMINRDTSRAHAQKRTYNDNDRDGGSQYSTNTNERIQKARGNISQEEQFARHRKGGQPGHMNGSQRDRYNQPHRDISTPWNHNNQPPPSHQYDRDQNFKRNRNGPPKNRKNRRNQPPRIADHRPYDRFNDRPEPYDDRERRNSSYSDQFGNRGEGSRNPSQDRYRNNNSQVWSRDHSRDRSHWDEQPGKRRNTQERQGDYRQFNAQEMYVGDVRTHTRRGRSPYRSRSPDVHVYKSEPALLSSAESVEKSLIHKDKSPQGKAQYRHDISPSSKLQLNKDAPAHIQRSLPPIVNNQAPVMIPPPPPLQLHPRLPRDVRSRLEAAKNIEPPPPPSAPQKRPRPADSSDTPDFAAKAKMLVAAEGKAFKNSTSTKYTERYERISQVGEGTYGKVYKAKDKVTGDVVALKRLRMENEKEGFPKTAMRELKLLQNVRHSNIVHYQEIVDMDSAIYMVFEYLAHDLTGLLSSSAVNFDPGNSKILIAQLLEACEYLHQVGILHRDIKASNLLLSSSGHLRLADFGLARYTEQSGPNDLTNRVVTLWYRPPELLLGATSYGGEIDMWSVGCIILELIHRKPVIQGGDEPGQLEAIFRLLGSPHSQWEDALLLPWYSLMQPREVFPRQLKELWGPKLSVAGLELVDMLLQLKPSKRLTASQALKMPYFTTEAPLLVDCVPINLTQVKGEWHEYEAKARRKAKEKDKAIT